MNYHLQSKNLISSLGMSLGKVAEIMEISLSMAKSKNSQKYYSFTEDNYNKLISYIKETVSL